MTLALEAPYDKSDLSRSYGLLHILSTVFSSICSIPYICKYILLQYYPLETYNGEHLCIEIKQTYFNIAVHLLESHLLESNTFFMTKKNKVNVRVSVKPSPCN